MGIKPIAKLYKITDTDNRVSCRVWSGGHTWPVKWEVSYRAGAFRDKVKARLIEAIERKGYVKAVY